MRQSALRLVQDGIIRVRTQYYSSVLMLMIVGVG